MTHPVKVARHFTCPTSFLLMLLVMREMAGIPSLERPKAASNTSVAVLPTSMAEATQVMLGHPRLRHLARSTDRQTLLP